MNKVNLILKTNSLNGCYINHFVNLITEVSDGDYFGIKIKSNDIIIEEISFKHISEIVDLLLLSGQNSYFKYDAILSINIEPL